MGLDYRNLDDMSRTLMLSEIERDAAAGMLYVSERLSAEGKAQYPTLLRAAAQGGTDDTLADHLRSLLNPFDKPRELRSGKLSKPPKMAKNAHETLAQGEFNRFYIRAICVRAIEDDAADVIVYRAKAVERARSASQQKIGQKMQAQALLDDLRANPGVDTALGLPPGPNSGLSVHLLPSSPAHVEDGIALG